MSVLGAACVGGGITLKGNHKCFAKYYCILQTRQGTAPIDASPCVKTDRNTTTNGTGRGNKGAKAAWRHRSLPALLVLLPLRVCVSVWRSIKGARAAGAYVGGGGLEGGLVVERLVGGLHAGELLLHELVVGSEGALATYIKKHRS